MDLEGLKLGSIIITTFILLSGSIIVIYNAILRLLNPVEINYNGMIIFAVLGVIITFLAAYFTKDGDSLNQKSVNLHMLEHVLGWLVVLVGAIITISICEVTKLPEYLELKGIAMPIINKVIKRK